MENNLPVSEEFLSLRVEVYYFLPRCERTWFPKAPAFPPSFHPTHLPALPEIDRNRKNLVTNNMAAISNGGRVFARTRRKIFRTGARNLANTTQSASQYCVNLVRYSYSILCYFIACIYLSTLNKVLTDLLVC